MNKTICLILCATLVFAVLLSSPSAGQPDDPFGKELDQLKKDYRFDDWPKETGKIISGVPVSVDQFPQLDKMMKVWREDNYSITSIEGNKFTTISQWWKMETNSFYFTMVVGPSLNAVKEYLIRHYLDSERDPILIKTSGREFGLNIGNLCFATEGERHGEAFSSIDFIRHNVLYILKASGEAQEQLRAIAERLDLLLLKKRAVREYNRHPDIPSIQTFTAERQRISMGKKTPLFLEAKNKERGKLRYIWTMTAGGVDESPAGEFFYYGGDVGEHRITVTVINNVGMLDTASIEITVSQP